MPRPSGGFIAGYSAPVANSGAAIGTWSPRDVYTSLVTGVWPVVGTSGPQFATAGYTRLWAVTNKSTGIVRGIAYSDTGSYAVLWWDGTTTGYASGDTFNKPAAGGNRTFEIFPANIVQTALLLHFDGANNSTTFTDSSSNNFTVTTSGTPKISTTVSKFGASSGYFNGSSGLSAPVTDNYSSGDWTIEFWFYPLNVNSNQHVLGNVNSSTGGVYCHLYNGRDFPSIEFNDGLTGALYCSSVDNYTWNHIALVQENGVAKLYKNGVLSVAGTISFGAGIGSFKIGNVPSTLNTDGAAFNGYIEDFRIVKGRAVYTGDVAAPTSSLLSTGATSLLLNFNGTNNSTTFTDSSANNFTITANGNAKLSTAQLKFGSASGYFDGTGSYLNTGKTADQLLGADGNWTLEMWIRPTSVTGNICLFSTRTNASGNDVLIAGIRDAKLYIDTNNVGVVESAAVLSTGSWQHVAFVRNSNVFSIYFDGTRVATTTAAFTFNNAQSAYIAAEARTSAGYAAAFTGHIDDLRVVKGRALYTADFTPPTAELIKTGTTSLLLNCQGESGSTTFSDSSSNNFTVTASSGAILSTAVSKFGKSSAYFTGPSSRATVPSSSVFDFGTGDFTIEHWVYVAGYSGNMSPLARNGNDDWANGYGWEISSSTILFLCGSTAAISCTNTMVAGTWYHLAAVRRDGFVTIYLNGVLIGSGLKNASISSAYDVTIGNRNITAQGGWVRPWSGYIADLRIVKGEALYSSNFTPPTAPLSPIASAIEPTGQFDGFDVSQNSLTQLRAENVSLNSVAGAFYGSTWVWRSYPYYSGYWRQYYGPTIAENGYLSYNSLSASALDQFYTDLSAGTGDLFVQGNPGVNSDTPTTATGKGYTVFGGESVGTSLLLHLDGTNNSTTFTDSSANNLTATVVANSKISTTQSKFGGASGYFDGSSRVTFSNSNLFNFGLGDFTVEFWVYPPTNVNVSDHGMVTTAEPTDCEGFWIGVSATSGLYWLFGNAASGWAFYRKPSATMTTNAWNHIVITRKNNVAYLFVGGKLIDFIANSTNLTNSNNKISVGGRPSQYFTGYLDELRVVKGAAIYDPEISLPPGQFPEGVSDPNWSSVSLLLHMNGTNNSTTFTDSSSKALTATAGGNAKISTAKSMWGVSSAYFDGSGDYVSISDPSNELQFGSGDFTAEAWVYPLATDSAHCILNRRGTGETNLAFWLGINGGVTYLVVSFNGTSWGINGAGSQTVPLNQWTHVALVRKGSTFCVYANGVLSQQYSSASSIYNSAAAFSVGGGGAANQDFRGYIDDVRVTKGVALYTTDFTPPTAALSVYP